MRLVIRLSRGPVPVQAIKESRRHRPAGSWMGVVAVVTASILIVGAAERGTFDGFFGWLVGLFFGR